MNVDKNIVQLLLIGTSFLMDAMLNNALLISKQNAYHQST
jgi:hypothetical protein